MNPEHERSMEDLRASLLSRTKLAVPETGLPMVGGSVPKNFAQDALVPGEIQLTVADSRDGGLSGSTLREAHRWGKVATTRERMVFGEATLTLPMVAGDAYHRRAWEARGARRLSELLNQESPVRA